MKVDTFQSLHVRARRITRTWLSSVTLNGSGTRTRRAATGPAGVSGLKRDCSFCVGQPAFPTKDRVARLVALELVALPFFKAHLCCRGLSHLTPFAGHAGAGGARNRVITDRMS
jgi:hypothetical protein